MENNQEKPGFMIFCVDDESAVLDAIVYDLQTEYRSSYDIEGASSAEEALSMFKILKKRNREIALFIADQRMPEVSGVEFLEKAYDYFPNSKRVILTGYADKENAINSINRAKVNGYFVKPWADNKNEIFRSIDKMLLEYTTSRMNRIELEVSIHNIFKIALLSEQRSDKFRGHSIRVAIFAHYIGKQLRLNTKNMIELCENAFIHDIGMLVSPPLKEKKDPSKYEDIYFNLEDHSKKGGDLLKESPYFKKYFDTILNHHLNYSVLNKSTNILYDDTFFRRVITIADTIDSKAMRPDIEKDEIGNILFKMSHPSDKQKLDTSIMRKVTIPKIDLNSSVFKESRDFVIQLIKQRGYLKLFNYNYE